MIILSVVHGYFSDPIIHLVQGKSHPCDQGPVCIVDIDSVRTSSTAAASAADAAQTFLGALMVLGLS